MTLQEVIKHLQGQHSQVSHAGGKDRGKKAKTSVELGGKNITGKVSAQDVNDAVGLDTDLNIKGRQRVTASKIGGGLIRIGAGRDFSSRTPAEIADVINSATGF